LSGIQRVGGGPAAPATGRAGRSPGGFRLPGTSPGQAEETGAAAALAPSGLGLLGLQEHGDEAGRDAAARRRGDALVEELRALQAALLCDGLDAARLERLAALADAPEEAADSRLREAVAALGLRARVELARLRRRSDTSRN
jgi:hypothetical protein